MKLLMQFSPASCYFLSGSNILFSTLLSYTFNLSSTLNVIYQFHTHKTSKIIALYVLIFGFLGIGYIFHGAGYYLKS
jgi:hypothetical protein